MGVRRCWVAACVVLWLSACAGGVPPKRSTSAAPAPQPTCPAPQPPEPAEAYVPVPASSVSVSLPELAKLSPRPLRVGEDFTVWGASYSLRSRHEHGSIAGKSISISGYIVKTNLADAPRCAVHATGIADPPSCTAPIPTFWIADEKTSPLADSIKVLGWASNFAQLHDAIVAYRKQRDARVTDSFWGIELPNPLPAVGAKIRVRGGYQATFTKATSGLESDPVMGVITYETITVLEPSPTRATLPGMRP